MDAPKVPKPLRYAITVEDIGRQLEAAESTLVKLIVSLLADSGLRRAELRSVDWTDLDREQDTIRVWGKRAKQRLVRYGPHTRKILDQWRVECFSSGSVPVVRDETRWNAG